MSQMWRLNKENTPDGPRLIVDQGGMVDEPTYVVPVALLPEVALNAALAARSSVCVDEVRAAPVTMQELHSDALCDIDRLGPCVGAKDHVTCEICGRTARAMSGVVDDSLPVDDAQEDGHRLILDGTVVRCSCGLDWDVCFPTTKGPLEWARLTHPEATRDELRVALAAASRVSPTEESAS